jgi:hypothetical protein
MVVHVYSKEKNLISKKISSGEQHDLSRHSNNYNINSHDIQDKDKQKQQPHHLLHNQLPLTGYYNVNIHFNPITPEAGKPTELMLSITDQRSGDPIKEFELVHDKLMHVIIVEEDLSYFAHIHPIIIGHTNDGTFTIPHTFPESGKYKLWVDFKPKDGNQTLAALKFNVIGQPIHKVLELVYDGKYTKESMDGQNQISLKLQDKIIVANRDADITFSVYDSSGGP